MDNLAHAADRIGGALDNLAFAARYPGAAPRLQSRMLGRTFFCCAAGLAALFAATACFPPPRTIEVIPYRPPAARIRSVYLGVDHSAIVATYAARAKDHHAPVGVLMVQRADQLVAQWNRSLFRQIAEGLVAAGIDVKPGNDEPPNAAFAASDAVLTLTVTKVNWDDTHVYGVDYDVRLTTPKEAVLWQARLSSGYSTHQTLDIPRTAANVLQGLKLAGAI